MFNQSKCVIRLEKSHRRFEIIVETEMLVLWKMKRGMKINEILNILVVEEVFQDAYRGIIEDVSLVQNIFQTNNLSVVVNEIITYGSIVITPKEEKRIHGEIVSTICDNCFHPETKKTFSKEFISNELKLFSLKEISIFKKVKLISREALKYLQKRISIVQGRMEVLIKYKISNESLGIEKLLINESKNSKIVEVGIEKNESKNSKVGKLEKEIIKDEQCSLTTQVFLSKEKEKEEKVVERTFWIQPYIFELLREKIEYVGGEISVISTSEKKEEEEEEEEVNKIPQKFEYEESSMKEEEGEGVKNDKILTKKEMKWWKYRNRRMKTCPKSECLNFTDFIVYIEFINDKSCILTRKVKHARKERFIFQPNENIIQYAFRNLVVEYIPLRINVGENCVNISTPYNFHLQTITKDNILVRKSTIRFFPKCISLKISEKKTYLVFDEIIVSCFDESKDGEPVIIKTKGNKIKVISKYGRIITPFFHPSKINDKKGRINNNNNFRINKRIKYLSFNVIKENEKKDFLETKNINKNLVKLLLKVSNSIKTLSDSGVFEEDLFFIDLISKEEEEEEEINKILQRAVVLLCSTYLEEKNRILSINKFNKSRTSVRKRSFTQLYFQNSDMTRIIKLFDKVQIFTEEAYNNKIKNEESKNTKSAANLLSKEDEKEGERNEETKNIENNNNNNKLKPVGCYISSIEGDKFFISINHSQRKMLQFLQLDEKFIVQFNEDKLFFAKRVCDLLVSSIFRYKLSERILKFAFLRDVRLLTKDNPLSKKFLKKLLNDYKFPDKLFPSQIEIIKKILQKQIVILQGGAGFSKSTINNNLFSLLSSTNGSKGIDFLHSYEIMSSKISSLLNHFQPKEILIIVGRKRYSSLKNQEEFFHILPFTNLKKKENHLLFWELNYGCINNPKKRKVESGGFESFNEYWKHKEREILESSSIFLGVPKMAEVIKNILLKHDLLQKLVCISVDEGRISHYLDILLIIYSFHNVPIQVFNSDPKQPYPPTGVVELRNRKKFCISKTQFICNNYSHSEEVQKPEYRKEDLIKFYLNFLTIKINFRSHIIASRILSNVYYPNFLEISNHILSLTPGVQKPENIFSLNLYYLDFYNNQNIIKCINSSNENIYEIRLSNYLLKDENVEFVGICYYVNQHSLMESKIIGCSKVTRTLLSYGSEFENVLFLTTKVFNIQEMKPEKGKFYETLGDQNDEVMNLSLSRSSERTKIVGNLGSFWWCKKKRKLMLHANTIGSLRVFCISERGIVEKQFILSSKTLEVK